MTPYHGVISWWRNLRFQTSSLAKRMPAPQNSHQDRPSDNLRSRAGNHMDQPAAPEMASNTNNLIPSKFKGQRDIATRWLDQFSRYSENKNLTEKARINDFFTLLESAAYDYCTSLPTETKDSWEALEAAFRKKFCKTRNHWESQQQLLSSKQGEKETLVDYVDRLSHLGLKEKLEENLVFSAIMAGMRLDLAPIVAQKNPLSLEELEDGAEQADSIAQMQAKNNQKSDKRDDQTALIDQMASLFKPMIDSLQVNSAAIQEMRGRSRSRSQERDHRPRTPTPHRRVGFSDQRGQNNMAAQENYYHPGHNNMAAQGQYYSQGQNNMAAQGHFHSGQNNMAAQGHFHSGQNNMAAQGHFYNQGQSNMAAQHGQFPHNGSQNNMTAPQGHNRQARPCQGCGEYHFRSFCRFKNAICRHCHKIGHIQSVCRSLVNSNRGTPNGQR